MAVAGDVVVVAAALPALGPVAEVQVFEGETTVASRGGAVDDDEIDSTHFFSVKVKK